MSRSLIPILLLFAACTSTVAPIEPPTDSDPAEAAALFAMKRQGSDDPHRSYDRAREVMRGMPRYSTVAETLQGPRPRRPIPSVGRWRRGCVAPGAPAAR